MEKGRKIFYIKGVKFRAYKNRLVCLEPIYLDIETSNNHAEKAEDLITWITSIQVLFHEHYYLLRKPEELMEFYNYVYEQLGLEPEEGRMTKKVITIIHNASYDLSYLIPYFKQYLPRNELDGGIIDSPNKFLTYQQAGFEWRCSYRLTNMSLSKWGNEMNVKHKKQIGLYDYERVIYQDDKIDEDSQVYDYYDVLCMSECLEKQNEYHGDDVASMPLTFTGYPRRELRKSCAKNRRYRQEYFVNNQLDAELYHAFLKSYAGGMTHNNRFYSGIVIERGRSYRFMDRMVYVENIGHRDFKSHYPSQMTCRLFPLGKPQCIYDVENFDNEMTIEDILSYYPRFSTMSVIRFYSAEIASKEISIPFMQFSKCNSGRFERIRQDNGRIIYARGEWIMYVDDLTLYILNEQYDLECEVLKVWKIKNEPLPEEIMSMVDKYFKDKSDKKNIVNELTEKYGKLHEETIKAQFDLSQTKIMLNSLYGVCAQNPLRTTYTVNDNMEFRVKENYLTEEDIQNALTDYYSKYTHFLPYQIGCYVTAWARYELYEFITAIGYDKVLYVDTDSAFYIKDAQTEKAIEELNEEKKRDAHFVILENGKKEYYDAFTSEPDCIAFKGLHSKCYGVVTDHGLELTIAGVPARTLVDMKDGQPVYVTREEELTGDEKDPIKALDKLDEDFEFKINAGMSAIYVGATGNKTERVPTIIQIDGHTISTAGGCVLRKLTSKKVKDPEYNLNEYEYVDFLPMNYEL